MRIKYALAALLIAGFVAPVLAVDEHYYVVRDNSTKKCSVIKGQPTSKSVTQLGGGDAYNSEADANTVMDKMTDCAANK
jgi:hypothetical protein